MSDRPGLAAAASNQAPGPHGSAPTATSMRSIVALLWRDDGVGDPASYYLLPRGSDPTLLVPVRPKSVAAAALRRYKTPSSPRDRLRMQALSLGVRVGLAPRLLRWPRLAVRQSAGSTTLVGHLEQQLGSHLHAAIAIGPPRQNRKPIVQLLTDDGRTVAFAKIGVTDVTRELVRRESAALQQVSAGSVPTLIVPTVLYAGAWRDCEVLALSALPRPAGAGITPAARLAAMQEVAQVAGRVDAAYGTSSYRTRVTAELERPGALADRLNVVAQQLDSLTGSTVVPFGAWHGDWAPWNMAGHDGRILLWDWERFETDVPMGFDALHFELQKLIRVDGSTPRAAVDELTGRAPHLLAPFGVAQSAAQLVVALYLLHVGARALDHEQDAASTRRGPIDQWLLPGLDEQLALMSSR